MPRRPHLILLLPLLLTGCALQVDPTHPTGSQRTECQQLLKQLPQKLDGRARVRTKGSSYAVAWGDPAVVLRCGVARPKDFDKTLGCQSVNGIEWFVPTRAIDDPESDVVMTSIGRSTNVEVTVPAKRRPPADEMVDIGAILAKATTATGACL